MAAYVPGTRRLATVTAMMADRPPLCNWHPSCGGTLADVPDWPGCLPPATCRPLPATRGSRSADGHDSDSEAAVPPHSLSGSSRFGRAPPAGIDELWRGARGCSGHSFGGPCGLGMARSGRAQADSDSQRGAKVDYMPHIFEAPGNSRFLPITSTKRGALHFIESAPKVPRKTGRWALERPSSALRAPEMRASPPMAPTVQAAKRGTVWPFGRMV